MEKTYWIFGGQLEIVVDEKATDSRYDLIVGTFPPEYRSTSSSASAIFGIDLGNGRGVNRVFER